MASDTGKTLKVRTVARFQHLQPVSDGSPATPGQRPAVARQWPGRRKTLKKWGQLYVFSTCMTIKAEIRSSPARMPRKNLDKGLDGFRHGQDPKSEDSCTFSVPPQWEEGRAR